jgi:hypothetical protein
MDISPQDLQELQGQGGQQPQTPSSGDSISPQDALELAQMANAGSPQQAQAQQPGMLSQVGSFIKGEIQGTNAPSDSILGSLVQSSVGSKGLLGVAQAPGQLIKSALSTQPATDMYTAAGNLFDAAKKNLSMAKSATDPAHKAQYMKMAQDNQQQAQQILAQGEQTMNQSNFTPGQAAGTAINAGLTVGTGGLGGLSKGVAAKTAPLLSKAPLLQKAVAPVTTALTNAGIGAGFQGASNLQTGAPVTQNMGTAATISAAIPVVGKTLSGVTGKLGGAGQSIINNVIGANKKDYAYGANPARAFAKEIGSVSSPEELSQKALAARDSIGNQLSTLKTQLGNKAQVEVGKALDFSPALELLDKAIKTAAERNDTGILPRLDAIRNAFINRLAPSTETTAEGLTKTSIVSQGAKDLKNMALPDAIKAISDLGTSAKWTGNPSDDKIVNKVIQQMYGKTRNAINTYADQLDPKLGAQLKSLNQRYHDVSSLVTATGRKDLADQAGRLNILTKSLGFGAGVAAPLVYGTISGDWAKVGTILATEAGLYATGKTLGSTKVQSKIGSFLMGLDAGQRQGILNSTPVLKEYWNRITGQDTPPAEAPKTIPKDIVDKVMPFLQLGKKAANKAGVGDHYDNVVNSLK